MDFYKEPHLDKPYSIPVWTGMGNVALKTANFLRRELQAEEFVEIERSASNQRRNTMREDTEKGGDGIWIYSLTLSPSSNEGEYYGIG